MILGQRKMTNMAQTQPKPHAICIPYPAQGHITPMLNLAKLLHTHFNFHITFVNTEHNHRRLLRSRGTASLDGLPSFRFEAIPDGLPPSDPDATQHIPSLSYNVSRNCPGPFKDLLRRLNERSPLVSLIVSDSAMNFTFDVAKHFGIPLVNLWTSSASSFLCYAHYRTLLHQGIVPLKDSSYLSNGYLDKEIDWIPSMEGIRLKDLPSFVRTTDKNDKMFNVLMQRVERICKESTIPTIFHTFDALDHDVLQAISSISQSPVYSIGPLNLHVTQFEQDVTGSMGSNLWKEDSECLQWLDSKDPNSVLYVNFGSVAVINQRNLLEIAWGLASSECSFVWILRPDLVDGESATLPPDLLVKTSGRGFFASWCDQKNVLRHPSVGGFLTHCGWNSVLESLCSGVPMICWPFFADQMTNSWICWARWGVGMEMDIEVSRNQVEWLVRELIGGGEKGKEMKKRAMEWKKLAEEATQHSNGSSCLNLERLVSQVLSQSPKSS